jgi:hypothetical protein
MKIKNWIWFLSIAVCSQTLIAAPTIPAQATNTPVSPDLIKKQFNEVATRLDTGGDLYIIANVDGIFESFVNEIMAFAAAAPTNDPDTADLIKAALKVPPFLKKNGFYAVHCCGMSAVPKADGTSAIKCFLSRDPGVAGLPLWKGLVGETKQRKLACADFLPADTVVTRVFNGNLPELWRLVRQGVKDIAKPSTAAAFDKEISNVSSNLNTDLDKLIGSAGDEGFFSIQLSRTATFSIPGMVGQASSIPTPSILIGVAVKDSSLVRMIDAQLLKKALPVEKTQVGDTTVKSVDIPLPLPIPLQATYAVHSNYFLFGSNTNVVMDAIAAFQKKNGLLAEQEFKTMFKGLPDQNNGFIFVGERLSKTIMDLQTKVIEAQLQSDGEQGESAVLRKLLGKLGPNAFAFTIVNYDNGVLVQGNSSANGKQLITAFSMAPVGLLAAIAIPSFVKARNTSQKNACINNLRIIDAAKEQWAMVKRKQDGDEVDPAGIMEYMKGGKMPICPGGGTYTINAIGAMPECSIPGHKANW